MTIAALVGCDSPAAPSDLVPRIALTQKSIELGAGQATQLTLTTTTSVTWRSENPSIATVSQNGRVFGVAEGVVGVIASGAGGADTAKIEVYRAISEIRMLDDSVNLTIGRSVRLHISALDDAGQPVKLPAPTRAQWSSTEPSVVEVDQTGRVSALQTGSSSIIVDIDGHADTAFVEVVSTSVAAVTLDVTKASFGRSGTRQLKAIAVDATGVPLQGRVFEWSSADPQIASVSETGLVTGVAVGRTTISVAVEDVSAAATIEIADSTAITPPAPLPPGAHDAALPQVYLATSVASTPSAGRTLRVAAGGNLQAALDSAVAGDKILLAAGATFVGNFEIWPKSGGIPGGWITVMSDGQLPAEGTRVSPAMASAMAFPKLVSPGLISTLITKGPATRWRFIGLEITVDPSVTQSQGLVLAGDASSVQNSSDKVPSDLIFDRIYAHGQPTLDLRKCFAFNSASTAIVDSYVSECHSAFDAQAVTSTNGPGPFKIVNNYLEAAAENIAFGGAPVWIANMVPADIEIRRNYFSKPLSWKSTWLTKNNIEFKVGRRILIEGNVLENSPVSAQPGWAFVLWSANAQVGCPWCITEDVTIRNNLIRNVAGGFSLTKSYDGSSLGMQNITIRNNVIIGLDNPAVAGNGRLFQITDVIPNITIEHNTGFSPSNSSVLWTGQSLTNHIVRDNLFGGGDYQLFTAGVGVGAAGWTKVAGPGSVLNNNVIALAPEWLYPGSNFYPSTFAQIGLAGGERAPYSSSAGLSDLMLSPASPYKGKASDGRDPGADIQAVMSAIAGVVP